VGLWLGLAIAAVWAGALLTLLFSVGQAVRSGAPPGLVLVTLVSLACGWLLVLVRLLRKWRQ
jgi:hypothetical protein